jgi:hypothetical protein
MMEGRDLKDLPHPEGIEQVRHWDDNNEQKVEHLQTGYYSRLRPAAAFPCMATLSEDPFF